MTRIHTISIAIILLVLGICLPSHSSESTFTPQTRDGFGAMLFFTEDLEFPKKFNEGGDIRLDSTTNVTVGKQFLMVVPFFGPGLSESQEPKLTMDIQISKPDGSDYLKADNAQVWAGKYPFSASSTQLADSIVRITIEPGDPIGTYKTKVKVKDAIKNVEIDLEKEFTVRK